MATGTAITGTGVYKPPHTITNAELCATFNTWVRGENDRNAAAIAAGTLEPLEESTPEFIEKASGIKQRYVADRQGILDPRRLCPNLPDRPDHMLCYQAEFAVRAAEMALAAAGRKGSDVDLIILASSNLQRAYPAIAIEVQDAIGASGYAYDVMVGCSSTTFAIQLATEALRCGNATCALVVSPELTTGHVNWRDRDSHFIFGDVGVALVIEPTAAATGNADVWEIVSTKTTSKFSSNIRNNAGFLNRCDPAHQNDADKLFYQQGRKVFKDVVPLASQFIAEHVLSQGHQPPEVARYWLHQANRSMNMLIAKRLLDRDPTEDDAPLTLAEYGNTAAAGSVVAFHDHRADLEVGDLGVLCSFGAGYSLGSVLVRRTS